MHRIAGLVLCGLLVAGVFAPATFVFGQGSEGSSDLLSREDEVRREEDLLAARALFAANLDAIRHHDRDAYLSCYWQSSRFTMNGPGGPSTGFAGFAENVGDAWPEVFDASHMEFSWLQPGVVYGSYRYRVSFDGNESTGRSERVLMETRAGWRIAVSTAFPDPPGTPPPPVALVGATLLSGHDPQPTASSVLALGEIPNAVVVLRDGKIECVGPECQVPEDAERIDVSKLWILAGEVKGDPFEGGSVERAENSSGDASSYGSAWPSGGRWNLVARFGVPVEGTPAHLLIVARDPRVAIASSGPPFSNVRMVVRGGEVRDAAEYQKPTGTGD